LQAVTNTGADRHHFPEGHCRAAGHPVRRAARRARDGVGGRAGLVPVVTLVGCEPYPDRCRDAWAAGGPLRAGRPRPHRLPVRRGAADDAQPHGCRGPRPRDVRQGVRRLPPVPGRHEP